MKQLKALCYIGAIVTLNGCFSQQAVPVIKLPPAPVVVQDTTIDLVVSANNTNTPLSVHFFELTSNDRFRTLDYFELMKAKESNLGGELSKKTKNILLPGGRIERKIKLSKDIRYYAIVASFKDVEENDNWRFIQEITPQSDNPIHLKISKNTIATVE